MITPVILTYNEQENIERTLSALRWAPRIVLLDSGSTDQTEQIARSFPNVSWFHRPFDSHAAQWSYGIHQTQIDTDHVLVLDADMQPSPAFQSELQRFLSEGKFPGAWVPFEYRVLGKSLAGSIYPEQIRIFRRDKVRITQPGHTQVFEVDGPLYHFQAKIIHEDRKPLDRWLRNQIKYASLEAARIEREPVFKDRIRLAGLSPFVWGVYSYLRGGGPLQHRVAMAYASERLIFEGILTRLLAEKQPPRD
jgi:glycosyltransferase involved in cell wall biosynthesis